MLASLAVLVGCCAVAASRLAEASDAAGDGSVAGASSEAGEGWQLLERDDSPGEAYELWGRLPPGSEWRAFRLIGDVEVPPEVAADVAMDVVADETLAGPGETRRLLLRTPEVVVNYVRADLPMVSDRDVTTRLERQPRTEDGVYRLVWHEANDEGPPLEEGVVRMPRARGSWLFRPLPGGRTRVVFESHAELGGSLPAWLINPIITGTIKANIVDLRAAIAHRGQ